MLTLEVSGPLEYKQLGICCQFGEKLHTLHPNTVIIYGACTQSAGLWHDLGGEGL